MPDFLPPKKLWKRSKFIDIFVYMVVKTLPRVFIWTVIILMTFEFISAAIITSDEFFIQQASIHQKSTTSFLNCLLSEKAEETEKNEEERDKYISNELVDFSTIAIFLLNHHSPVLDLPNIEHPLSEQTPLFSLFCVYLI